MPYTPRKMGWLIVVASVVLVALWMSADAYFDSELTDTAQSSEAAFAAMVAKAELANAPNGHRVKKPVHLASAVK